MGGVSGETYSLKDTTCLPVELQACNITRYVGLGMVLQMWCSKLRRIVRKDNSSEHVHAGLYPEIVSLRQVLGLI